MTFPLFPRAAAACAALLASSLAAQAAEWRTTATYFDGGLEVARLTVDWTAGATGRQSAEDLWELSWRLQADAGYGLGGAATDISRDEVIAGVAQPLGGVARTPIDLFFSYNFDDVAMGDDGRFELDTDFSLILEYGATVGSSYWAFVDPSFGVVVARYENNVVVEDAVFAGAQVETVSLLGGPVGDVPLPAGLALLPVALAGFGLIRRRA